MTTTNTAKADTGGEETSLEKSSPQRVSSESSVRSHDVAATKEKALKRVLTPAEAAAEMLNPTSEDDIVYPQGLALAMIMLALCLAIFLVALDRLIIVTAIPKITDRFNSLDDVGWYGSSYLLTMCAFQLLYGKVYQYFSMKSTYLSAIAIFELGSLVCAVAPSSKAFIIGRAVAGLGCAGIWSGALIILAYSVPLRKRSAYGGFLGSMFGLAAVLGPILGGAFSDSPKLTWRFCFYINLPIGAIAVVVIILFFKSPKRVLAAKLTWKEKVENLDLLGLLAFLPAIICLLLALQWGGTKYSWSNGRIIALLTLFSFFLVVFGVIQVWKGDKGTLPPRILRNRTMLFGFWYSVTITGGMLSVAYFMPIWFQAIRHTSAINSGIRTLPTLMGVVLLSIISGSLTSIFGFYVPFLIASGAIVAIGGGLLTTLVVTSGHAQWIGYQFLFGAGVGTGSQLPIIASQAAMPLQDIPISSSIIAFAQSLGGAIFISVGQTVFSERLITGITAAVPDLPNAAEIVLGTGAINLRSVFEKIQGGIFLDRVLVAYSDAVTHSFFIAVGLGVLSFLLGFGFEWIDVKKAKAKQMETVGKTKDGEDVAV